MRRFIKFTRFIKIILLHSLILISANVWAYSNECQAPAELELKEYVEDQLSIPVSQLGARTLRFDELESDFDSFFVYDASMEVFTKEEEEKEDEDEDVLLLKAHLWVVERITRISHKVP